MKATVSNQVVIEKPSAELIKWCKRYLVVNNPEYAKKARMHFWLGSTPKRIALYEQRGDALILPFGVLKTIPDYISRDCSFVSAFACTERVDYGDKTVPLYDYQEAAVNALYNAQYGILQSPAGSGKTQVGIALTKKYGRRTLWLTHTLDLLQQSKARAEQYIDSSLIGTITEGKVNVGKGITFATVQTMCRLDLPRFKDVWDVIIVDECHRCSGTPTAMTQFYKVLNNLSARHKFGLSATVHRSDDMIEGTYALLGQVAHTVPESAVGDRIMKVGVLPIGTGVEISDVCLNTDGTLNYPKLISYLCESEERNDVIRTALIRELSHSCLILSDRLEHLSRIIKTLPQDMQEKSVMVSGKMTNKGGKAQREKAIEDMRTGAKKYLFATYSLAKEGLDIPRLERLFLTTPQKDYAVVTQSIGRVARACEGKADPVVYDFVDDIGFLVKSYKKRCSTYRKNGCYFMEDVK